MRGRQLYQFKAFCAVVEHGSFTRAAAHLGLPASSLSQIVKTLETRLGLRLFNRTTRSVSVTEVGQRLYQRIAPALSVLEDVETEAAAAVGRVSGRIRLNASRIAATQYLAPILADFLQQYPEVQVDVVVQDQLVDVVDQGFDGGIRLGEKLHQDMIAVPISGDLEMKVVASPSYLAHYGTPEHPADLLAHRCLCYRNPSDASPYRWEFEHGTDHREVTVTGPIIVDEPAMLPTLAVAGTGVAYQFAHQVDELIDSGQLVQLLADWTPPFPGFFMYYPSHHQHPPAFKALLNFLRQTPSPISQGSAL